MEQNLALSRIKRDCDFSKGCSDISIDSQPTEHHKELARLLFQRCGFFGSEKKTLSICKGHFKEFTDNFTKRYTQKTTCMNIYHHNASKIAVTKKKTGWPCSLQKSQEFWNYYGALVPVDSFVCESCQKWMKAEIDKAKEKESKAVDRQKLDKALEDAKACAEAASKAKKAAEAAAARAEEIADKAQGSKKSDSENMEVDSEYCPSSFGERDDNFIFSQDSAIDLKRGHLNKLFEIDGLTLRCENTLRHKIELNESYKPKNKSDYSTYYKTLQCLANGFVSILHTIVSDPNEDYKMYRALVSSRAIVKLLQGRPLPDRVVAEIFAAINAASSNNQLVERLSLLTPFMTYPELSLFFPPKKPGQDDPAEESSEKSEPEDVEYDGQIHTNWDTEAISVRLTKRIGKKNWNNAVNHYITFGNALERKDTVHRRQSLPMKTLTKIMDFFCSKQVLQQVKTSLHCIH